MSDDAQRLQVLSDDQGQSTVRIPGPVADEAAEPGPEHMEAAGAGLAGAMRTRLARIHEQRTREFGVPGWEGDLVLRARYMDREAWQQLQDGGHDEDIILFATAGLLIRPEPGAELVEIPGAFGPALALELGMPPDTPPRRLVSAVMDDRGPWVSSLAGDVMSWLMGRRPQIEALLGE